MALVKQPDSRQIPKIKKYTADKAYCDILYATLQERSSIGEDGIRFVEKKDINYSKLATELGLSRQTVSKKLQSLKDLQLVDYNEEEKRYKLNILPNTAAMLVPPKTLRQIVNGLSENSVSLYVYFLDRFLKNEEKDTLVTMQAMKEHLGMATSTTSNNVVINDIMAILKKLELIDFEVRELDEKHTGIFVTTVRNVIPGC